MPVHAAEGYLLTLIHKGFRIAVCEQMEDSASLRRLVASLRATEPRPHRAVVQARAEAGLPGPATM